MKKGGLTVLFLFPLSPAMDSKMKQFTTGCLLFFVGDGANIKNFIYICCGFKKKKKKYGS